MYQLPRDYAPVYTRESVQQDILNRIKDQVDAHLRDQQAGFRKDRSCPDCEREFENLDRKTLWNLLRHYKVPGKIVNTIKNSNEGMTRRVVHGGQLTEAFEVKTGVCQGCLLFPFLFLLAIDWIMKMLTVNTTTGTQWARILFKQLDDLDFTDDLALLSHTRQQTQEKINNVPSTTV
ncbi:uncharacterized protein LOC125660227 [Ostrea edulis]|uniref:uncharacterized protein LOC125660227 n=1 Tax=Ostrea edulis TaxID=37623 RepID=UPI0024AF558B|nr:uncharacterized protein LOC125660227 [Ostrea edulis]